VRVNDLWKSGLLRKFAVVAFYVAIAILCALAIKVSLGPTGVSSIIPAFLHLSPGAIALSTATVICAFGALVIIERLSMADVVDGPTPKVVLAPFVASTLSLGAGFGPISGSALRVRLYAPFGIGTTAAIYLATTATLALLSGGIVITAVGSAFGFLRLDAALGAIANLAQIIGAVLGVGVVVLIAFAGRRGRSFTVFKRTLRVPSAGALLLRIGLGTFNWACTAVGLYVLIPDPGRPPLLDFIVTVSALKVASLMTGAPAGLGVFEALMLSLTKATLAPANLAAALIASRILSFVVPVMLAGLGAVFLEAKDRRIKTAGDFR
jgi:uncharacterized membrane protein YbhN (UPF0104 family)